MACERHTTIDDTTIENLCPFTWKTIPYHLNKTFQYMSFVYTIEEQLGSETTFQGRGHPNIMEALLEEYVQKFRSMQSTQTSTARKQSLLEDDDTTNHRLGCDLVLVHAPAFVAAKLVIGVFLHELKSNTTCKPKPSPTHCLGLGERFSLAPLSIRRRTSHTRKLSLAKKFWGK